AVDDQDVARAVNLERTLGGDVADVAHDQFLSSLWWRALRPVKKACHVAMMATSKIRVIRNKSGPFFRGLITIQRRSRRIAPGAPLGGDFSGSDAAGLPVVDRVGDSPERGAVALSRLVRLDVGRERLA